MKNKNLSLSDILNLLSEPPALIKHIMVVLHDKNPDKGLFQRGHFDSPAASAVLFLMGHHCVNKGLPGQPCLILNKRSSGVRQAGDLCFPGGGVAPRLDTFLSKVLAIPSFPLARWPHWSEWHNLRKWEARQLSILLSTSLRESLEEMRLNPLGVKFLGPLVSHNLLFVDRVIYPMVGWITRQRRFFPNWEVEKIVYIPMRNLLDPDRYACYRLQIETRKNDQNNVIVKNFPCYKHQNESEDEVLWGATYHIVMDFFELVFGFTPPPIESLPIVHGYLNRDYFDRRR